MNMKCLKFVVILFSKFILWKSYVDFEDDKGFFISLFIFYISFLYNYLHDYFETYNKRKASLIYKKKISKIGSSFTAAIIVISLFGMFEGIIIKDSRLGLSSQYFGDFYSIHLGLFLLFTIFIWLIMIIIEDNNSKVNLKGILNKQQSKEVSGKKVSEKTGG